MQTREETGVETWPGTRRTVPGPMPARALVNPVDVGGVMVAAVPLDRPAGATDLQKVVYGTAGAGGRDLHLWLHARSSRAERQPGIVFIHGGGWAGGSPALHLRHCHDLAARGWVAATIEYRLSPEAPWPAALEDVRAAIRWMRASADELGLDPQGIAVAGGSAGGHLAAMAALAPPGHWEGDGGNPDVTSQVQAAVLWYPITDMRVPEAPPEAHEIVAAFLRPDGSPPDESVLDEASPCQHVSPNGPPVLTITGEHDELVRPAMIDAFHDRLDAARVANELVVFEGRDHGFDLCAGDWDASFEVACAFLDRHLGRAAQDGC